MTGHNFENLTGQIFGRLTVLDIPPYANEHKSHMYLCECECGVRKTVSKSALKHGMTKSCGCLVKEVMTQRFIDLTNQRFGRLTVLSISGKNTRGTYQWLCRCDCKNEKTISGDCLRSGDSKSCGCLTREKGAECGKNSFIDLINQRFGRLVVISVVGLNTHGEYGWLCQCDCGNMATINGCTLRAGTSTSCGCYQSDSTKERHKNYRTSKGLDPNEFMDSKRLEFKASKLTQKTLERDRFRCQFCYRKNELLTLEVHHIRHWSTHEELRFDEKNLITLCTECHREIVHNGNMWAEADEKTIKFLTNKIEKIYMLKEAQIQ